MRALAYNLFLMVKSRFSFHLRANGSTLRSGAYHPTLACEFCKSLNALKNLTISSVQLHQKTLFLVV